MFINCIATKYMTRIYVKENKVNDWKAYLRWSLLNRASKSTMRADFYGKNIKRERSKRRACFASNQWSYWRSFELYVEKKFPAEAKS
jgi:endothelin-converting enzyme/putative endopeptidase